MSAQTLEAKAIVRSKMGLHARPATKLVKLAQSFNAEITLIKGENSVSASSVLGIMMLGSHCGESVVVRATGDDAKPALEAIIALISCQSDE